jgi:hypothetical protein
MTYDLLFMLSGEPGAHVRLRLVRNPQSTIRNPQSTIRNPQSAIHNPQSIRPQNHRRSHARGE